MGAEITGAVPGEAFSPAPRIATAHVLVALRWLLRYPAAAQRRSARRRLATDPGA